MMLRRAAFIVGGAGIVVFMTMTGVFLLREKTTLPEVKPAQPRFGTRLGIRPYVPYVRPDSPALLPETPTIEPALQRSVIATVGVLRQDGTLLPLANFDGEYWVNDWPQPYSPETQEQPRDIPSQPSEAPSEWWGSFKPDLRWELLQGDGARQVVTVTGIREFQTHCEANIGLTTDFTGPVQQPPPRYIGVVATLDNLLAPIASVDRNDRDYQEINRLLPELFSRVEPEAWRATEFEPLLTGRLPAPTINFVHRGTLPDGRELLRFEASRALPLRAVDRRRSRRVTKGVGWLTRRGTEPLEVFDVRASPSAVAGEGIGVSVVPLAALTIAERTYWLGNLLAYEGEAYLVIEVGRSTPTVELTVTAGGC